MTHAELITTQIANIVRNAKCRALNELQDGFSADDMQAIDAPRFIPPATFSNIITMRKAMAITGRGGDHANA